MGADPGTDDRAVLEERLRAFLLEDYKLKVGYLTDHFSRMWTRFNFFLTLETLVAGALAAAATTDKTLDNPWQVAVIGLLISACWYVVGAQDRYLIDVYRSQIRFLLVELARNEAFVAITGSAQARVGALWLLQQPLDQYRDGKTTNDDFHYPYTGGTIPMGTINADWLKWRLPG